MIFLLFFILSFQFASGFQVPICRAVNYSGVIYEKVSNNLIFTYNFNLKIKNDQLILSNINEWSPNEELYRRASEYRTEDSKENLLCQIFNGSCTLLDPNGIKKMVFDFEKDGLDTKIEDYLSMFFKDGTIFDGSTGDLMDPEKRPCLDGNSNYGFLIVNRIACCIEFEYFQDTKNTPNTECGEFESNISIIDSSQKLIDDFTIKFHVKTFPKTFMFSAVIQNIPEPYDEFQLSLIGKNQNCFKNATMLNETCKFSMQNLQMQIIEFNWVKKTNSNEILEFKHTSAGELIMKEGKFLKNYNQFFTLEDPCWTKSAEIPTGSYQSSFCCTKFNPASSFWWDIEEESPLSTSAPSNPSSTTYLLASTLITTNFEIDEVESEDKFLALWWLICGVVFVLALISTIVLLAVKHRKLKKEQQSFLNEIHKKTNMTLSQRQKCRNNWITYIESQNLFIDFNFVLGKGSKATVYKATLNLKSGYNYLYNKVLKRITECNVAAKIPLQLEPNEAEEFIRELNSLMTLKGHPNIVTLLGWTTIKNIPVLVTELAEDNLLTIVKSKKFVFSSIQNLQILWQISRALEYVAQNRMIHRDVACRNILITSQNVAKLADFGLCFPCDAGISHFQDSSHTRFPIRWLSIEVLKEFIFSEKSDVWAFGILCFEVFSKDEIPYSEILNTNILEFLENGNRLSQPDGTPCAVYELMLRCWHRNASERPNFVEITKHLQMMLEKETYGYINLLNY